MMVSMVPFVLTFLLVVEPDMAPSTVTTTSAMKDPCDVHMVACNPTTLGARPVIITSSIIYLILAIPAIIRVWNLKRKSRSEDDTLFWWHLCFLTGGSSVWVLFSDCSSADSTYSIYGVSLFLSVIYFILIIWATVATAGKKDWRLLIMIAGPVSLWIGDYLVWLTTSVRVLGWWGCVLVSIGHSFRVASTNYRENFRDKLCGCDVRILLGGPSFIGAIGGGLWLINPQLCFSLEYKVTCYAIGLLRAWETVQWISRPVAKTLAMTEGQMADDGE